MKDKIEILRTFVMILHRPTIYTHDGSLVECLSLITGIEMGIWNPGEEYILSRFPAWLNKNNIEAKGRWVKGNPGAVHSLLKPTEMSEERFRVYLADLIEQFFSEALNIEIPKLSKSTDQNTY